MRMKKGLKIRIVASKPTELQDEFSIVKYIGKEYEVVNHWQNSNSGLDEGEIQIDLTEEGGIIILNSGEYEVVG